MRWSNPALWLAVAAALAGCRPQAPPPPPLAANPHFVREPAWLGDGKWFYPQEMTALDQTGLASIAPLDHPALTTDGELYDPTALAAAHQTLQLPAIVTVTDLENGRQIEVRVNDRGPANPCRVIALTPRAAQLLQIPAGGVAQVRIVLLPIPTEQLAAQLHGGTLHLAMNTDPVGDVSQQALAPPTGVAQSGRYAGAPPEIAQTATPTETAALIPDRLPENITLTAPNPGQLYIRVDDFGRADYAMREAAILSPFGTVLRQRSAHGNERFFVRGGPYPSVADADAELQLALRLGLKGAHITVE